MIAVIDYGMGNLRSVQKGFEKIGADAVITNKLDVINKADGVVLPGVGAFADAIDHLRRYNLDEIVVDVIKSGKPFLGICLGLQLLFDRSSEDGEHFGLGILKGTVERLPDGVKIPHMGWNQVRQTKDVAILKEVSQETNFYFVHSYVVKPQDASVVAAVTDYGSEFVSGVSVNNMFAFQFHPEKSGIIGLEILKNFSRMTEV